MRRRDAEIDEQFARQDACLAAFGALMVAAPHLEREGVREEFARWASLEPEVYRKMASLTEDLVFLMGEARELKQRQTEEGHNEHRDSGPEGV